MPKVLGSEPVSSSKYLQIERVSYEEKGLIKTWDIVKSMDSVGIVIYHKEKDGFIYVRQFRLPVFLKNQDGFMYELCAGLLDKNKSPKQTAIEEIQEECGYFVESKDMYPLFNFFSGVGTSGAYQHLFYTEVTESMKKTEGGGNASELENIDVIFVPRKLVYEFLNDTRCSKSISLAFGTTWFLTQVNTKHH
ncbi:hypothetical protein BKH43_05380 [Helicobacter sp. 13S00401-1]|nr:hypothetical protein BKH43_05380 [Helicobacter sp. 13S00401-1]